MKIIVKFAPEITIKSRSVRIFFSKILTKNIRTILNHKNYQSAIVIYYWDYIDITCKDNKYVEISEILINIPGIHHFLLVHDSIISSLEDIYDQIMVIDYKQFVGKSFCIRVKRSGKHSYSSQDIASYLGNKLLQIIHNTHVNLKEPEKIICLEIKNNKLFVIIKRYEGVGGLPIGTQQKSLSLISGGFDSPVASYMLMRRGSIVHYCFFNFSGSIVHTMEIYKIIYYLWNKFGCSHKVKIVSIDFMKIVEEILSKIEKNYIGIVLKRMMIRAAAIIADKWNIKALITGEVLGQVSSQTLDNLMLINNVESLNCIILRPLIAYDKEKIVAIARTIGTEIFSRKVPEYCGLVSKKTTIKANKKYLDLEENKCDLSLIMNEVISQAYVINVNDIPKFIMHQHYYKIDMQTKLSSKDIVLDIRTQYDQEIRPLQLPSQIKIKKIPFFQLVDKFHRLDQSKTYFLYCDHGVMSKLQAMYLYQQGFRNVKIYQSLIKNH